jgi:hypothetical protein
VGPAPKYVWAETQLLQTSLCDFAAGLAKREFSLPLSAPPLPLFISGFRYLPSPALPALG